MNDKKQENEDFEIEDLRGDEREPFVKRIAKFSAFLYLGLAILVVIVAAIGIFSISYDDKTVTDISLPELELGNVSLPTPDYGNLPVQREESGVTADVSMPNQPADSEDSSRPEDETPQKPVYCRPVEGEIIKGHSMDSLVFSQTMKDYRVHPGVDIASALGAEVVAYTDGVVASVTDDYFYGTTVAIEHAEGVVSYYMNLDPTLEPGIAVGTEVTAGQPIGKVGQSARLESADKPHLHFELKVNGSYADPETELP